MAEKAVDTFCGGCHIHVPVGHEDRTNIDYDNKRWHRKCHRKHIELVVAQALAVSPLQITVQ